MNCEFYAYLYPQEYSGEAECRIAEYFPERIGPVWRAGGEGMAVRGTTHIIQPVPRSKDPDYTFSDTLRLCTVNCKTIRSREALLKGRLDGNDAPGQQCMDPRGRS